MFKKPFLLVIFIAFILGSVQVQAQELDATKLAKILSKSDSIRQTLIYTGVVKIQHPIQNEGDLLQVWRNKNEFYHDQSLTVKEDTLKNNRRDSSGRRFYRFSFMPEQKYIKLLLKNYSVSYTKAKPVAGRKTMRLTIKPKYLPRFGLSIWFDEERFHILQREINYYDSGSEKLIFSMKYQNIQYDILPPDSLVNAQEQTSRGRSSHSSRPKKVVYNNLAELKAKFHKPFYTPRFVPAGCELVSIKSTKDEHREMVEMHYADGILNVSMFQFWSKPPKFVRKMLQKSSNEEEAQLDFRQLYAVKKGDVAFLFLGNFCVRQLQKMADSLVEYK